MCQIERPLFEDTVKTLNNYYAEAEKMGGRSYLEGCLACVTAYVIFLCMETRYEKVHTHTLDTHSGHTHTHWTQRHTPQPAPIVTSTAVLGPVWVISYRAGKLRAASDPVCNGPVCPENFGSGLLLCSGAHTHTQT